MSYRTSEEIVKNLAQDLKNKRVEILPKSYADPSQISGALNDIIRKHVAPQSIFKELLRLNKNTRDVVELLLVILTLSGLLLWLHLAWSLFESFVNGFD